MERVITDKFITRGRIEAVCIRVITNADLRWRKKSIKRGNYPAIINSTETTPEENKPNSD